LSLFLSEAIMIEELCCPTKFKSRNSRGSRRAAHQSHTASTALYWRLHTAFF